MALPRSLAGDSAAPVEKKKANGAARLLMTAAPFGIYCPHIEPVEAGWNRGWQLNTTVGQVNLSTNKL
jgi:hypothetical protein